MARPGAGRPPRRSPSADLGHARLVDPQAGVLGLGLDQDRPAPLPPGDRLAGPDDREVGRRQAAAPQHRLGPGLRVAEGLGLGRASGVGQSEQFEEPGHMGLAAARPAEPLDQVEDDVRARVGQACPGDRPIGGAAGTGQASKPWPAQGLDDQPGDLDDVGLGGRSRGGPMGARRGVVQDRDAGPSAGRSLQPDPRQGSRARPGG